jgi:hypothetical protein
MCLWNCWGKRKEWPSEYRVRGFETENKGVAKTA